MWYAAGPDFLPASAFLASVSPARRTSKTDPTTPKPVDVYRSFKRWKSKSAPAWHSIQKMRYVFWRMMSGRTITDAIREIHWTPRGFWSTIDMDREGKTPFKEEYQAAKLLQSRAIADSVMIISEARDVISRNAKKELRRMIARAVKRSYGKKNLLPVILNTLLEQVSAQRKDLIARNKLQIDSAKWFAAKTNPNEYADKSSVGLSGLPHAGEGDPTTSITIAFVGADGKEVPFNPTAPAAEASE